MATMLDPSALKLIAVIARCGSINKAAAELHTAQSNLSTRLRALEDAVGASLFERSRGGTAPTELGRRLLPFAQRIETVMRDAQLAVMDQQEPAGTLRLGAMETTAAIRLPQVLPAFTRRFPKVDLILETGSTELLKRHVSEGRLDGALVSGPVLGNHFYCEEVYREDLVFVTAKEVRGLPDYLGTGDIRMIVFREGCSYRAKLEHFLETQGMRPTRILEFGTLEGILACVSAGLGATMMPRAAVQAHIRAGRVAAHDIPQELAAAPTVFITRIGTHIGLPMRIFLDKARRQTGL